MASDLKEIKPRGETDKKMDGYTCRSTSPLNLIIMAKIHKDCPLTKEDIDAIKAELYYINSTNHCINPPHPSWYRGLNDWQAKQQEL